MNITDHYEGISTDDEIGSSEWTKFEADKGIREFEF